jgi:hypothetical protein
MQIVIYIVAALYLLLAAALLFTYYRTRHPGPLMMALTYGSTAGSALLLMHWAPLLLGFIIAWVLRLMGLEAGSDIGGER